MGSIVLEQTRDENVLDYDWDILAYFFMGALLRKDDENDNSKMPWDILPLLHWYCVTPWCDHE